MLRYSNERDIVTTGMLQKPWRHTFRKFQKHSRRFWQNILPVPIYTRERLIFGCGQVSGPGHKGRCWKPNPSSTMSLSGLNLMIMSGAGWRYPLAGLALAVALSIIDRLRRQYRPDDTVLLQDGTLAPWADERLAKHHKYRSSPHGTVVYRFAGSIFFENADYFKKRVITTLEKSKEPVSTLIIDAGAVNDIDYTAAEMLKHLCQKLYADDIRLILAHVPPALSAVLEQYGLLDIVGEGNVYASLEEAIFDLPTSKRSTVDMVKRLDISSDNYVVIGGGVLEALKLRDTNDVDLVVSDSLYKHFVKEGWREYVQDDGKRILSHHGYQVMLRYVGKSLRDLKPKSFILEEVRFMSVDDLIAAKQKIGRQKDLDDLKLLRQHQRETKKV